MSKNDNEYVKRKIENCKGLIDNATSDAQREIYQGYLDYWKGLNDEVADEIAKREKAEQLAVAKAELEKIQAEEARKKADADLEIITKLATVTPGRENFLAEEFEGENPNKHAYRYKDGEKIKTSAFIEFITTKLEPQ